MSERALSLTEAAAMMGWSRRTLIRALARHGIATIGTGRRARLEAKDIDWLKRKSREDEAQGVIYAIQGAADSPVKIGFSRCAELHQRLRALQTGNPHPLRVLASITAFALQERTAHGVLAGHRLSGEWFDWQEPVKRFVASLQAGLTLEAAMDAAKAAK